MILTVCLSDLLRFYCMLTCTTGGCHKREEDGLITGSTEKANYDQFVVTALKNDNEHQPWYRVGDPVDVTAPNCSLWLTSLSRRVNSLLFHGTVAPWLDMSVRAPTLLADSNPRLWQLCAEYVYR